MLNVSCDNIIVHTERDYPYLARKLFLCHAFFFKRKFY